MEKEYEALQDAEATTTACSKELSEKDRSQVLLNNSNFWPYRENIEKEGFVERVVPHYPYFEEDRGVNPYPETTFYCQESFAQFSPAPVSEDMIRSIESEEEEVKKEPKCGEPIKLGKAVDQAEKNCQLYLECFRRRD